jgi:hypothetical protein
MSQLVSPIEVARIKLKKKSQAAPLLGTPQQAMALKLLANHGQGVLDCACLGFRIRGKN